MKRPIPVRRATTYAAFTLVEIMVALALSLVLLAAVIGMLGRVSEGISDSRSLLEMAARLRLAEERLQMDLGGVTVTMNPPADPSKNQGYFEYIEGPAMVTGTGGSLTVPIAVNSDNGSAGDPAVGDFDDILMFTTRSSGRPFVGKCGGAAVQSSVAEVAWFVRGRTLHRRVLLVLPGANLSAVGSPNGYYATYDISARWNGTTGSMVPNTLSSLTQREHRFAHPTPLRDHWTWTYTGGGITFPTLPTLDECSSSTWSPEHAAASAGTLTAAPDFWTNDPSRRVADNALIGGSNNHGSRISDDVILNNVIGFDVKGWDPVRKMYVDLGYRGGGNGLGHYGYNNDLVGSSTTARIYDTWSTTYFTMASGGGFTDHAINGLDDDGNGIVDDESERPNPPPYPVPLRGIQVKIRVFEPDSKQIREVTVVQDFLPQ